MGIYVNTNVTALRGQNYLNNVNNSLNTTYQRLSSGLRINSAKDDAAGLQIADRLTTQINGLNQGNRNANDGIALAQTMEGGLDEIGNMLQRIRTLAVQASNGINTEEDREAINAEALQLTQEITRIAEQTTYGGKQILFGGSSATNATSEVKGDTTNTIFGKGESAIAGNFARAAGKISFQVGANSGDTINLTVQSFDFSSLAANAYAKKGGTASASIVKNSTGRTAFGFAAVSNDASAVAFDLVNYSSDAISTLDKMIAQVDDQRSILGSIQNRLESSIKVQSSVSTNTADARSRIRDTDFAEESANLSQQNIIQQAATSMLMQANARPQLGLSLLG